MKNGFSIAPTAEPASARRGLLRNVLAVLALSAALVTSACGFEPVYARRGAGSVPEILARIEISPIPERSGQILRNHLIDMFDPKGERGSKPYVLSVRVTETPQVLALRRDDVISRGGYSANAVYRVVDRTGRVFLTGGVGFGVDFEIADSERATAIAREAARDRLMQVLAESIRDQIASEARVFAPPAQAPAAAR